ncbi:hypothetical protein HHI36_014786 [Cryptolaemus montrouzieri]|uniref:Uncharacterized protein n=1 Tax=Cryptolaemus montrouzieri TaxID=559131 RepID=A0ABD2N463_9CUCU
MEWKFITIFMNRDSLKTDCVDMGRILMAASGFEVDVFLDPHIQDDSQKLTSQKSPEHCLESEQQERIDATAENQKSFSSGIPSHSFVRFQLATIVDPVLSTSQEN